MTGTDAAVMRRESTYFIQLMEASKPFASGSAENARMRSHPNADEPPLKFANLIGRNPPTDRPDVVMDHLRKRNSIKRWKWRTI